MVKSKAETVRRTPAEVLDLISRRLNGIMWGRQQIELSYDNDGKSSELFIKVGDLQEFAISSDDIREIVRHEDDD